MTPRDDSAIDSRPRSGLPGGLNAVLTNLKGKLHMPKPNTGALIPCAAWMPDLAETKKSAADLRMRSLKDAVAFRYSGAGGKQLADPDRTSRVLVIDRRNGQVFAFDCYMGRDRNVIAEHIAPACGVCGCTEDRACVESPPHAEACPVTRDACGNAECTCGAWDTRTPCSWAPGPVPICTACDKSEDALKLRSLAAGA